MWVYLGLSRDDCSGEEERQNGCFRKNHIMGENMEDCFRVREDGPCVCQEGRSLPGRHVDSGGQGQGDEGHGTACTPVLSLLVRKGQLDE